ncbi:MAG: serine hydrolase domain-containing protein [Ignavibacteriales bacterium]
MKIFAAVFLLFISTSVISSQQLSKSDERYIDSLMSSKYKPEAPGAVILAARDGKVMFMKGYGLANMELSVPVRPEYIFPVASITKQFTAVSLLQLVQKGQVSLQDDIRKYLPDLNTHGRKITLEQLLTHTGGLNSFSGKPSFRKQRHYNFSKDELVKLIEEDTLLFEPGQGWSYSNSGYSLLGLVVEKVSGITLHDYYKKNIFKPLKMDHTYIGTNEKVIPGFVPYYTRDGQGGFKPGSFFSFSWLYGSGDLLSCADDMLKWDEALYSDILLKEELRKKAWTSSVLQNGQKTNYGFGWEMGTYNGMEVIRHDGILGYLSDAIRIPEKHIFVTILSNNNGVNPNNLSAEIALRLAGESLGRKVSGNPGREKMQEYTGTYEISQSATGRSYRQIVLENDTLYSQSKEEGKLRLSYAGNDKLAFDGYNYVMEFHRDKSGKIEYVEIFEQPVNYGPNEVEKKVYNKNL